jgi:drug/metabolite transporter (DMT)-like permease
VTTALPAGVGAATAYGVGDFLQGVSSRRLPSLTVLVAGQAAGLLVVLAAAAVSPEFLSARGAAWGAAAGGAAAVGTFLLLQGFRTGRLGVVSPTASVTAAGLPLAVDLLRGTTLGPGPSAGVALAVFAVVLVSRGNRGDRCRPASRGGGAGYGLGAGVAHAGLYVFLDAAGTDDGVWPVAVAYVVLVAVGLATAAVARVDVRVPRVRLPAVLASGALGAAGTVLFLVASGVGSVGVAAVVVEMSPVLTVVLARAFLAERLPTVRVVGLVTAVVALVLLSGR